MNDLHPVRRALLSVSDKTGLIELGKALAERGVELLSTGGTAKALRDAGLAVKDVSEITGFPEMMDGRVKTLHPMVHGGLLALRDNDTHIAAMNEHGIGAIDLLVVNLYPFEATVAKGAGYDECVENIDIGGPAMIRAAAKNHAFVNVVVDVEDYDKLLDDMDQHDGATCPKFRRKLAQEGYARTAAYDTAVSNWLADALELEAPRRRAFAGELNQTLRYGENSHQQAAFYTDGTNRPGVATAVQHQARNSATTISTTPTRPLNWLPSLTPSRVPPAPSSSTPTHVAWPRVQPCLSLQGPPSTAIAPLPSAGSWR